MDIYSIERFCERWIVKADAYRSDNLEDLFDRFFTLFVAYNRFYSAAAELYRTALEPQQARLLQGDRREATTIMSRLIGQPRFVEAMNESPAVAVACKTIADLLENHHFFLHSVRYTHAPDIERDNKLAVGLRNFQIFSVLECLYQIRCNIFHGEKEFTPRQAELLGPAVALLETIVQMSKTTLHDVAFSSQN